MAVALALLIAGLTALDRFLARTEQEEVRSAADRSWRSGRKLLSEGRAGEALDALRNAHTLERDNSAYEVDMIAALLALGRTAEADPLMDETLQRKPNDGPANLMAGRLRAKEGDAQDAEAQYHRAVYGEWPGEVAVSRRNARLELIDFLTRLHAQQELLAELISLEAESGGDDAVRRRLAHLFLVAESPGRAATVYRALIAKYPDEAELYEGLGEAELRQAEYRRARAAFLQASFRHQGAVVGPRLVLLNEVIQLDPTPRQLPTAEKYDRSLRVLAMAKGDLEALLEKQPGAANAETAALLKTAADALAARPRSVGNELAEQVLDLAVKVWKARVAMFGPSTSAEEEALKLTMERIAS
jgi:tetratricopeptide (TPR) repeat protein